MKIIAINRHDEGCIIGDNLDEITNEFDAYGHDLDDYEFYEFDPSTKFEVEQKLVRKEVIVRKKTS